MGAGRPWRRARSWVKRIQAMALVMRRTMTIAKKMPMPDIVEGSVVVGGGALEFVALVYGLDVRGAAWEVGQGRIEVRIDAMSACPNHALLKQ